MIKIGFFSPSLVVAVLIQLLCQFFKVVYYSIKNRELQLHRFMHPAGMPSAHSAFVTALTVSIGIYNGFGSELFALSFVFSVIIIYDSIRLRGAVQRNSQIISRLSRLLPESERGEVPQYVGHTLEEIIAGILVGGLWALIASVVIGR
jgi:acid phosphatase family membrane protein YuiD